MFFLSGMGALVFENVWFSQIGWSVGNSVWSAALVVAAFMAGLGLGNGAAVLLAPRLRNLVLGYAGMEALAALSGAAAVFAFPLLPGLARPLLMSFVEEPAALNAARAAVAFCVMVVPATALGATLPLLAKPLEAASGSYGYALGRLYGVNTLGALAGTLLAELALVPALGLRGSGLAAAACNLSAALIALQVARHARFAPPPAPQGPSRAAGLDRARIALAAFVAGGVLLGLEVIWFRFLLLFQAGTTLMFALMLAVVLAGIALGAMAAARGLRRGWSPARAAQLAAGGAALAVVAGYASFHWAWRALLVELPPTSMLLLVLMSFWLMAPVCLLSGVLFTALGAALRSRMADAVDATGALTLANTVGAMAGSLAAGFVLLPWLGIEASFFALALAYGLVVLAVPNRRAAWLRQLAPAAAAVAALAFFPFGRMKETHYPFVEAQAGARLVAVREGLVETAFYFEHRLLGETLYHRLQTNSHSMSASDVGSQRYMRLFAYLPAALHPRIERALVICFGVGNTASALAELPDMKSIDVVDVSRNILELGAIAHPEPRQHPLRDPRTTVRVEDGRFFLQHTDRRYDLITGEPPPPKMARVVSLYTREYFELVRSRLNPGGLASYWLPAHQLLPADARVIIRAFCDAFEDCSLWSGIGLDWILLGTRGDVARASAEDFTRLWRFPRTAASLRRIAIETPEHLVAQFMADAPHLREIAGNAPPLVDDFPHRLSSAAPTRGAEPLFAELMHPGRNRERLQSSPWVAAHLPAGLIARSGPRFRERALLDQESHAGLKLAGHDRWADLEQLLRGTTLVTLPAWLLGSHPDVADIARRRASQSFHRLAAEHLAIDALANRRRPDPALAGETFAALTPLGQVVTVFHHCLVSERERARTLMAAIPQEQRALEPYRSFFAWAAERCG